MSVIVTLVAPGDPKAMERIAAEDPARLQAIVDAAKSHGLIAHRFYGSGEKMMVDRRVAGRGELPARSSPSWSRRSGRSCSRSATGEPEITFWTKLETGDDFGWDA